MKSLVLLFTLSTVFAYAEEGYEFKSEPKSLRCQVSADRVLEFKLRRHFGGCQLGKKDFQGRQTEHCSRRRWIGDVTVKDTRSGESSPALEAFPFGESFQFGRFVSRYQSRGYMDESAEYFHTEISCSENHLLLTRASSEYFFERRRPYDSERIDVVVFDLSRIQTTPVDRLTSEDLIIRQLPKAMVSLPMGTVIRRDTGRLELTIFREVVPPSERDRYPYCSIWCPGGRTVTRYNFRNGEVTVVQALENELTPWPLPGTLYGKLISFNESTFVTEDRVGSFMATFGGGVYHATWDTQTGQLVRREYKSRY